MKKIIVFTFISFCILLIKNQNIQKGDYGYLFCHMSDYGEYTAYAISRDGYNYEDILEGKAIINVNEHPLLRGVNVMHISLVHMMVRD